VAAGAAGDGPAVLIDTDPTAAANCVSRTRALIFVTRSVATKLTDLVTGVTDCARSGV